MREILFRGKRIDNGEWVQGSLLVYPDGDMDICYPSYKLDELLKVHVDPATVGQFTGLTDKNCTKIFEGDIMRLSSGAYPCLVYFDGRGMAWMQNNKRREIDLTRERMSIVGNIHDNPELMKEG